MQVMDRIKAAMAATPAAHAATLFGERKAGSKWGREVVYTIHPGLPLRPGVERSGMTAVKLIQEHKKEVGT